jgi:sugar phosphate isomerase/epimerase
MLNLAFSTNAFKKTTLEEAIETIARIGYRAVEIMADVPHAYPPQMDTSRRLAIRRRLRQLRLRLSNINAFTLFACGDTYHPTWFEDDLGKRELRILHTLMCIELAAELGAKTVSLQPGGPLIGTNLTRRQAAKRFANGLNRVLPAAKKAGITLAIEPEPGLFIQTAAEYIQFKKAHFNGEQHLGMNCDLGHLYCAGDDPAAVLRNMPQEIAHIHLEDIAPSRVHQHLVPGKGAMDFPSIFAALKKIGYKGYVTVELYPYETTAAGVAKAAWDYLKGMSHGVMGRLAP